MIGVIITCGENAWDISSLVENVKLSGRLGAAARSLVVSLLDDDSLGRGRANITVEEGFHCNFTWKGEMLFTGIVTKTDQGSDKQMTFTAKDNAIYLTNNRDSFSYSNWTASAVFIDVCNRIGVLTAKEYVMDTKFLIPEISKAKSKAWDVITFALSETYKATGERYYPICIGNAMHLLRRRENVLQWVLEAGEQGNIEKYSYSRSIDGIVTRVKLLDKDGNVLATAEDRGLESKVGMFQEVDKPDDELNQAQLIELANSMLREKSGVKQSFSITARGIPAVKTGLAVYVLIPHLQVQRTFYIESDSHSFQGLAHSMTVKLLSAEDFDRG